MRNVGMACLLLMGLCTSERVQAAADDANYNLGDVYSLFESDVRVTAATKIETRAEDAPAIITVISRATILARGFRSVGEALSSVPGLFAIDDLVTVNLGVRGVMAGVNSWSRLIKFMVNGVPVTYEAAGGALLGPEFLPIDAVSRIEVIRGPGSALYGANAFLGVVNVVTQQPDGVVELTAGGEIGVTRNHLSHAEEAVTMVKGSGERPASMIAAFYTDYRDRSGLRIGGQAQEIYQGLVTKNDTSQPIAGFFRGVIPTAHTGEWTGQLIFQGLDAFNNFSTVAPGSNITHLVVQNILGRVENRLSLIDDKLLIHTFVGFSYDADQPQERLSNGSPIQVLLRERVDGTWQAGTEASWKLDASSILAGVDYSANTYTGDTIYGQQLLGGTTGSLGDRLLVDKGSTRHIDNLGVYGQGILHVFPDWSLTAGLRYDHPSDYDGSLSYRAGFTYATGPFHAKLLYGTSYVPPAPLQLFQAPLQRGDIQGTPNLQPQTAGSLELYGSYQFAQLLGVQVNGYWTHIDQRVEYVFTDTFAGARNLTSSDTFGAELGLEARQDFWFVLGNVSYSQTLVDPIDPAPNWFAYAYGDQRADTTLMPAYPTIMGHATLGVTFPAYFLEATATVHGAGRRGASEANILALNTSYFLNPYATVDLNVRTLNLEFGGAIRLDASLHIINLFDTDYTEPGNGAGVDIPTLGRCAFLRVRASTL